MNIRALAQEGVSWYMSQLDPYATHQDNVQNHLRAALLAFTLSILQEQTTTNMMSGEAAVTTVAAAAPAAAGDCAGTVDMALAAPSSPSPPPSPASFIEEKKVGADWRDYLPMSTSSSSSSKKNNNTNGDTAGVAVNIKFHNLIELENALEESAGNLHKKRTQARLEAFLVGVCLMVTEERPLYASSDESSNKETSSRQSLALIEGLAGFRNLEKRLAPTTTTTTTITTNDNNGKNNKNAAPSQQPAALKKNNKSNNNQNLLHRISSAGGQSNGNGSTSSSRSKKKMMTQVREPGLVTRLELYLRSLLRVKSLGQECVLAAEPQRALKARAESIVTCFIDTVGTVREQSPILTRLLTFMTMELLAVDQLSESLVRAIRRLVSDYEHKTSFASLAFLSSPDDSAEQKLTPAVLKYLKGLQADWENCVADCELERMLTLSLDPEMRHVFKTIEFRSIGHLLETCAGYRGELQKIELAPGIRSAEDELMTTAVDNPDAVRQAILDLQRERITVNGHLLAPVTNRKELIHLLSQTLNSRTLSSASAAAAPHHHRGRRSNKRSSKQRRGNSGSESELNSSANESDHAEAVVEETSKTGKTRRRNFPFETIDLLTRRLILAGSRTGTGGDAYFVVRDLFGGDDVEVVPAEIMPTHGRSFRPGTIEILVKLSNVTIKCHGSFDVYPKSMVGDCEPLIQLHTTTTETISLREVRASDSQDDDDHADENSKDLYSADERTDGSGGGGGGGRKEKQPLMVIQERMTDRTGWRTLAIRPALYEKVEVWNTPS